MQRAGPVLNDAMRPGTEGGAGETAGRALPSLMSLYLREVRRFGRLEPQCEQQLLAGMDAGQAVARETLICHHLGLVIAMARGFGNRGLDLLDLIEEGNVGMLVALQKFEPQRGLRFSTYAAWWIRHYLQTAVATQVPIVRPPLRAQLRAARAARRQWRSLHAGAAGAAPDGPEPAGASAEAVPVTPVPLEDGDAQMAQAGRHHPDAAEEVSQARDAPRLAALIRTMVAQLPPRQREIIVARYGLDGGDECTLQQISSERGVTRERIRQVQAGALQALRAALEGAGITREAVLG